MQVHNVNDLSELPNELAQSADLAGSDMEEKDEDKDKFKCLYLLVETAVAVRQREKEQGHTQV